MGTQQIHTDALVELYSMSKMYAEENPVIHQQEYAIREAETLIENTTGWEVTQPYDDGDE